MNMTFVSSREVKKYKWHPWLRHSGNEYFFTSLDRSKHYSYQKNEYPLFFKLYIMLFKEWILLFLMVFFVQNTLLYNVCKNKVYYKVQWKEKYSNHNVKMFVSDTLFMEQKIRATRYF